jgi:(E)-4-hydroxy-3-methylbut-2-enyl-diphosphate synthase
MLYKGRELVKRNIDEAVAVEELVDLIKANGDWESVKFQLT